MKLFHIIFISSILFPLFVDGTMLVRILFNQGNVDPNKWCNPSDLEKINRAVEEAENYHGRNLREAKAISSNSARELPVYPAHCKQSCQGYSSGCCLIANCKGFRRQTLEDSSDRELFWNSNCYDQIWELDNAIDDIMYYVSQPCYNLLSSPRSHTCVTEDGCMTV